MGLYDEDSTLQTRQNEATLHLESYVLKLLCITAAEGMASILTWSVLSKPCTFRPEPRVCWLDARFYDNPW